MIKPSLGYNAAMSTTTNPGLHLLGATREDLLAFMAKRGYKSAHAFSLFKAIHRGHLLDFTHLDSLPLTLRQHLASDFPCSPPKVLHTHTATDGTQKYLIALNDGSAIETVFIPEPSRGTLCVSSQVGCALNCDFCATGKQGFSRNLTAAEIIAQIWIATREHTITNVVFMGMGEPLLNLEHVIPAISILLDDCAYNLSKYTVTVSTAGLIPQMQQLAQQTEVSLALSLHAPNDLLRTQLMPINKKYPLLELMAVCKNYFKHPKRKILFEYILIDGVNDTDALAHELAQLLTDVPAKINLIPFNPIAHSGYQRSTDARIKVFQTILRDHGFKTFVRKTRGPLIDAACGQLKGDFIEKTKRRA